MKRAVILVLSWVWAGWLYAENAPVQISLGIRDSQWVKKEQRVDYPLAFRVLNSGTVTIAEENIPGLFFSGTLHVQPKEGAERKAAVATNWRTAINDLRPGEVLECPVYGNLLDFFPDLADGDYTVWWTRAEGKSAALPFHVEGRKVTPLPPGPLGQPVEDWFYYESFEEARRLIGERTGIQTEVEPELAAFMQKLWLKRGMGDAKFPETVPAAKFLDRICGSLALSWKYDAARNTVALTPAWQRTSAASTVDLLKTVTNGAISPELEKDAKWQEAFNALLSAPQNRDRAWKVRMQAEAEEVLIQPTGVRPLIAQTVVAKSGKRFTLILTYQPIFVYPGHGTLASYWFDENGKIAGAGLANSGHRSDLTKAWVEEDAVAGAASTICLGFNLNGAGSFLARLQLGDGGLLLIDATDENHASRPTDIGKSVLKN